MEQHTYRFVVHGQVYLVRAETLAAASRKLREQLS